MPTRYFVLEIPGFPRSAPMRWLFDGLELYQIGTALNTAIGVSRITVGSGETVEQAFGRVYNWINLATSLHETLLPPGGYHPRMVRPLDVDPETLPGAYPVQRALYASEVTQTTGQLVSLVGRLNAICQIVEPVEKNLKVFGHEIRECLMLAAMEVESHCKAVLRANGVEGKTTEDYAQLLTAMKLDEYEVTFSRFPFVSSVRPFLGWNRTTPSQSLSFYSAYNAVKHDRERSFDRGTLEMALNAVAACAVLAAGQFGWPALFGRTRSLEEFFTLTASPKWSAADMYMMEAEGWPPYPVSYSFGP